jgi:hypothetical protein
MSIHEVSTPPPKPKHTEGMERLGVVSSAGKTSHTYVPIIQTPPDTHSPDKREARSLVNRKRMSRAKTSLENKSKRGRPKGAKDKNPRTARGSKRTKKKIALPKESADVSARVANEANEGGLVGTKRQLSFAHPKRKQAKLNPTNEDSDVEVEGVTLIWMKQALAKREHKMLGEEYLAGVAQQQIRFGENPANRRAPRKPHLHGQV